MASEQAASLRKRQQIAKANRTMFLWVAGASVIVGFALVVSIFLIQTALFREKVLGEKARTVKVLQANNEVVDELQNQVRVLNTNDNLKQTMAPGEVQPVQVILDALPAEANSSAFGASLQEKLLNAPDIQVENIMVQPVAGVESSTEGVDDMGMTSETDNKQINFRFVVSSELQNAGALKALMNRLEKSIRPIDTTNAVIESQGNRLILTVEGSTYYEPSQTVELGEKTVAP